MKDILNEVINNSALKLKAKTATTSEPGSTSEPALDSSPQPPTDLEGVIDDEGEAGSSSVLQLHESGKVAAAANGFLTSGLFWANKRYEWPALIWKRYRKAHRLQKIGFRIHKPWNLPDVFEVIGSDDCTNWMSMMLVDNEGGFTKEKEFR